MSGSIYVVEAEVNGEWLPLVMSISACKERAEELCDDKKKLHKDSSFRVTEYSPQKSATRNQE